jgi:hypothetical protein
VLRGFEDLDRIAPRHLRVNGGDLHKRTLAWNSIANKDDLTLKACDTVAAVGNLADLHLNDFSYLQPFWGEQRFKRVVGV